MHELGMRGEEDKPEEGGGGGRALTDGRADPLSYVVIIRFGCAEPMVSFLMAAWGIERKASVRYFVLGCEPVCGAHTDGHSHLGTLAPPRGSGAHRVP